MQLVKKPTHKAKNPPSDLKCIYSPDIKLGIYEAYD